MTEITATRQTDKFTAFTILKIDWCSKSIICNNKRNIEYRDSSVRHHIKQIKREYKRNPELNERPQEFIFNCTGSSYIYRIGEIQND